MSLQNCRLKVEAAFYSSHAGPGVLTMAASVTMGRLHFLEGLCASWEGPLIVAAYLPLIAGQPSNLSSDLRQLEDDFNTCATTKH